ncbi:DEAD/DEAH box helicase family protein [Kribbella endophytica]
MPEQQSMMSFLWPHQRKAVEVIGRHISAGVPDRSALITMPTGTGKTAVIAAAIDRHVRANPGGHVLVVTPWLNLVDQLRGELDSRL